YLLIPDYYPKFTSCLNEMVAFYHTEHIEVSFIVVARRYDYKNKAHLLASLFFTKKYILFWHDAAYIAS
ncbi:MAG: hypothetical protein ACOYMA_20210, partial [Bacteroidia bacterium]